MDTIAPTQKPNSIFDPLTFRFLAYGWAFYIMIAPIYIFKSGLPQPADMVIAIVAPLSILLFIFNEKIIFNRVFTCLCLVAALFFAINIINFYYYRDTLFLYSSIYYVFNAFVFSATIILFKANPEFMKSIARKVILITVFGQLLFMMAYNPGTFRLEGTFNNPNQLGYWALLTCSYLLILNYGRRMPFIDIGAMLICTFFIVESLSRAALISHVLIILAFVSGRYMTVFIRLGLLIIMIGYSLFQIAVLNNVTFFQDNFDIVNKVSSRIETVQTESGVVEERGYERIINYPHFMIYGAGEGAHWRYAGKTDPEHANIELHSGLATILISYGAFGFILFATFIFTIFQRVPILLWLTIMAVMAYGITHQHIRFTGFWVFLAFAYVGSRYLYPASGNGVFPSSSTTSSSVLESNQRGSDDLTSRLNVH